MFKLFQNGQAFNRIKLLLMFKLLTVNIIFIRIFNKFYNNKVRKINCLLFLPAILRVLEIKLKLQFSLIIILFFIYQALVK